MKVKLFACAASALCIMTAPASAGDLKGYGTAACSDIVTLWQMSSVAERDGVLTALGQWSFGYLSGRNMQAPRGQRKELASFDNDQTAFFIVEQCAAYPNARVYQIVDVIYDAAPYMTGGV